MLPASYELPAAILITLGGALACFAGYRLFKIVLAIYGFILGAAIASSVMGVTNTVGMVLAALAGGVLGALTLVFAYFVGIALVGAGLGALIAHVVWTQARAGDPPALLIVAVSIAGAVGAMLLQRYVIIVGTAFGGAWTMVVGALEIAANRGAVRAAAAGDVWILYPFSPGGGPARAWTIIAWVVLGILGITAQLAFTGTKKRK
jgi:hypothetical protein